MKRSNKAKNVVELIAEANQKHADAVIPPPNKLIPETMIYDKFISMYDTEKEAVYAGTGFSLAEFNLIESMLKTSSPETRGRKPTITNFKDRLLLVMILMHTSSFTTIQMLSKKLVKSKTTLLRILHKTVEEVGVSVDLVLSPELEEDPEYRDVGCIIDCTIIPGPHPSAATGFKDPLYSGKHSISCYKFQVAVTTTLGKAMYVSPVYEGSVHDYTIFIATQDDLLKQLGNKTIMADSAYIGAVKTHRAVISDPHTVNSVSKKRVLVEQYFGRLKQLFPIFRHVWKYKGTLLNGYFRLACALTNVHIIAHPLRALDTEKHVEYLQELVNSANNKISQKSNSNSPELICTPTTYGDSPSFSVLVQDDK